MKIEGPLLNYFLNLKLNLVTATIVFLLFDACSNPKQSALTLYYGGDIITMESDSVTYVEALVEQDGKILFTGTLADAAAQYPKANKNDIGETTLLPGFIDAHSHFLNVGIATLCANLLPPPDGPGSDIISIINTLNVYKESEDGKYMIDKIGWILGNGYDDSQLTEKAHPKAIDLDKVSKEIPVIVMHQSGHLASVNSKGLELLQINTLTPDPEGGVIRRDSAGNPNGVLEEAAFFKVLFSLMAKLDIGMAKRCIEKGQLEYARNGYLTIQDGRTTQEQLTLLKAAAILHAFYLDVVSYPDITLGTEHINGIKYKPSHTYSHHFRIGGVKLTLDGSPQGKTAWLTQCYQVNPEGRTGCYTGYPVIPDSTAQRYVETAYQNKWQIICHANGDAAIDQYLNAVDKAQQSYHYPDHRTVLIHGQTLRKDQIPELVRLNVIPSLFPMHTFYWGDWHASSVLGEERAAYISPTRDVRNAGLIVTSHHDAPVTFPNSMRVLDATVNRTTRSGRVLGSDQRLTPYEGLQTLTTWAAYQCFEENQKGTLTPGKLADFVILDKNPLKIDPATIHTIQVITSIKEGKVVYMKESQ